MQILEQFFYFIVAIAILVTVHEFGHFWVARKVGVKVLRFSVGFGRPLWSRRFGPDQIEYVIAAIPLGGYVKMLDEAEGPVAPNELHRAFNRQVMWKRVAVVVAGPLANFLFAIVAYALMFMLGVNGMLAVVGYVSPQSVAARAGLETGDQIIAVDGREVVAWEHAIEAMLNGSLDARMVALTVRDSDSILHTRNIDLSNISIDDLTRGQFFDTLGMSRVALVIDARLGKIYPGGAAERGGLLPGDLIVAGNDQPIASWRELVSFVEAHPDQSVSFLVRRGDVEQVFEITPLAEQLGGRRVGKIKAGPDEASYIAAIDRARTKYSVVYQLGFFQALASGSRETWDKSVLTLRMFGRMLIGEVSLKNLSGPISIAQYVTKAAEIGLSRFLQILAVVSIGLGIVNLLPVPVLDGGHLLFYFFEAIRGGRPLPESAQFVGMYVGIVLLVGLMGLAFYNDLSRVFSFS